MYSLLLSLLRLIPCGDADVFGGAGAAAPRPRRICGVRLKYSLSIRPFSLNVFASRISTIEAAGTDAKIVAPSAVTAPRAADRARRTRAGRVRSTDRARRRCDSNG